MGDVWPGLGAHPFRAPHDGAGAGELGEAVAGLVEAAWAGGDAGARALATEVARAVLSRMLPGPGPAAEDEGGGDVAARLWRGLRRRVDDPSPEVGDAAAAALQELSAAAAGASA